ncbi:hypothetical protein J8F10_26395 [Gemmata sp. G18]|uniref:DUF1795 domain-containing protein n=1 Tax=Gemmata palustris TaxID=2822762 RepID=A0ABS5BYH9_9BACT|nr:hypothetical protein [Gemmata palustris]MBP3958791.1 hypothetical protein [Gemmata palustris]
MRGAVYFGVAFLVCSASLAAQPQKDAYTSTEGKYAIKFPNRPKTSHQIAKSALGDLDVNVATYATGDANVFMVSYTDYPAAATKPENRKTLFDGIQDGIKGSKGEIVSEKAIEFGPEKLPGRELVVDRDKGKQRIKFRAVLRDNRLYQIAVIGTAEFVSGKDATAFFESLELTK